MRRKQKKSHTMRDQDLNSETKEITHHEGSRLKLGNKRNHVPSGVLISVLYLKLMNNSFISRNKTEQNKTKQKKTRHREWFWFNI